MNRTELDEQRTVVAYLRRVLPKYARRVFSVPNERRFRGGRGSRAGQWRKLAEAGASAGVPDLVIPGTTPSGYGGIVIEMKRTKNSTTRPEQWKWLLHFASLGWIAVRCRGADEALTLLRLHGYR